MINFVVLPILLASVKSERFILDRSQGEKLSESDFIQLFRCIRGLANQTYYTADAEHPSRLRVWSFDDVWKSDEFDDCYKQCNGYNNAGYSQYDPRPDAEARLTIQRQLDYYRPELTLHHIDNFINDPVVREATRYRVDTYRDESPIINMFIGQEDEALTEAESGETKHEEPVPSSSPSDTSFLRLAMMLWYGQGSTPGLFGVE